MGTHRTSTTDKIKELSGSLETHRTSTTNKIKELSDNLELHKNSPSHLYAKSCEEIQANTGSTVSGVYTLTMGEVFCDMTTDGGGWTVLQQRGDNGNPEDFFYKYWADYEQGFGDPEKDYWVGLKYWNKITQSENMQLLVVLEDFSQNKMEASYTNFKISDASDNYRMDYTAAETKYDSFGNNKGKQFTTRDDDNDVWSGGNCAEHR